MRAILTYHSVDRSGSPVSVSPETFAAHVRWLSSGHVRVVPLEEIRTVKGDAVAITFDDGYRSVEEEALPRLVDHGMPATVFAVAGHVGSGNVWDRGDARVPQLPLMDWDALGRLSEQGLEIGAHTRRHPRLDTLGVAALEDEILGGAAEVTERLGRRPRAFAYPYGRTSAAAVAIVRRSFARAVTTELRCLRRAEDAALLPRLDAYSFRAPGQLERWGSAAYTARLGARRAARTARRLLGLS